MTDLRASIIDAYETLEAQRGGIAECDPKDVMLAVALSLNVPYEDVERAMADHWTMAGAG